MDLWNALSSVPVPVLFLLIVCLTLITVYMIYEHAKLKELDGIRVQAYRFILKAEHMYASGEGKQKLKYVVNRARLLLPKWLQFFITDEILMNLIDLWFLEIKDLLDDGKINESSGPPGAESSGTEGISEKRIDNE
mgnify:CR=1 FL=1